MACSTRRWISSIHLIPATIDTEYKAGDDMLYVQYLRDSGDDVQAAAVIRRNLISGDVESDVATYAMKYHGFSGEYEYDVLDRRILCDTVFGLGFGRSIGGAHWGCDLVSNRHRRRHLCPVRDQPELLVDMARQEYERRDRVSLQRLWP